MDRRKKMPRWVSALFVVTAILWMFTSHDDAARVCALGLVFVVMRAEEW